MSKKGMMYALYKGDNFIDLGTKEYLAELIGVDVKTILFYSSPVYLRRIEKRGIDSNAMIVVKIEDDDEIEERSKNAKT